MAWLAVALMAAALAATLLPVRKWRVAATAGLALAAVVLLWGATMFALQDATDAAVGEVFRATEAPTKPPPTVGELRDWEQHNPQVRNLVHHEYGFWIAIIALSAVGVANTVQILRDPVYGRDGPAANVV